MPNTKHRRFTYTNRLEPYGTPSSRALLRQDEEDTRKDKTALRAEARKASSGGLGRKDAIAKARWHRLIGVAP
jgi:hypothetical protein